MEYTAEVALQRGPGTATRPASRVAVWWQRERHEVVPAICRQQPGGRRRLRTGWTTGGGAAARCHTQHV